MPPSQSEELLVDNLRVQLEALNGITFSDTEWERFFTERIAGDDSEDLRTNRWTGCATCPTTAGRP